MPIVALSTLRLFSMKKSFIALAVMTAASAGVSANPWTFCATDPNTNFSGVTSVFGGADLNIKDAVSTEAVKVVFNKGDSTEDIHGGSYQSVINAVTTTGNTAVEINGGTISGEVFGGSYLQGEGASTVPLKNNTGNTSIVINDGELQGMVFGGSRILGYNAVLTTVVGDTSIVINGGSIAEGVFTGGMSRSVNGTGEVTSNSGDATVNINGGTINGIVGGGLSQVMGNGQTAASHAGNITINVKGGTVNALNINGKVFSDVAIVGGGVSTIRSATALSGLNRTNTVESITINITGGTINGSVYGGAVIESGAADTKDVASVGDVAMTISGGTVTGDVVTGGAILNSETPTNQADRTFESGAATVILKDGTNIGGYLVAGSQEMTVEADGTVNKTQATAAKTEVVIDSANVKIAGGVVAPEADQTTITATGNFNDSTDGAAATIAKLQEITKLKEGQSTFTVAEGMYNNGGSLDTSGNFVEHTNTLMRDTLDLATGTTFSLNRILMNDVRKRMGDLRSTEGKSGAWARYDGGRLSGEGLDNDFNTIQVGVDTVPTDNGIRFGIAASYTNGDADYARGSADMDAYGLAFYGTWMGDSGLFADVVARMAKADTDVTIDGNKKGSMDNVALSLSGEVGYRYDVTKTFFVEPQAELAYTYVDADTLKLSDGSSYEYDAADSLIARIGAVVGLSCPNNMGNVYARVSAVHEFLGDTAVTGANGTKLTNDGKDTWVEFGVGAQYNINPATYVWADVERTEGAALDEDWRATVGVRYAF